MCDTCGQDFSWPNALKVHIKRQHQGVTYPCSICKENLSSPTAVRLHIKTVHEKRADMFCDKCGKAFGRSKHLERHKKTVHNEMKPPRNNFIIKT